MSHSCTINCGDQLRGLLTHSQQVMLQHRCISLETSPSHFFTLSFRHLLMSSPVSLSLFHRVVGTGGCVGLRLPGGGKGPALPPEVAHRTVTD